MSNKLGKCKDRNNHALAWILTGTFAMCPLCKVVMSR
jgi:hypothetical protein